MLGEETAPHSLEPQFRRLGLSTYLVRGVPTLKAPHTVCKAGDALNANQVQLLKLFLKTFATVRPSPCVVLSSTQKLTAVPLPALADLQFQIKPKLGVQLTNGQVCGGSKAE